MLAMNMYVNQNQGWAPNMYRAADPPNSVHYTRWYHKDYLGQYMGNRATYDQQKNTTDSIYCAALRRVSTGSNDTIGIGYNMRSGSQISLDSGSGLVRFTSIRRSTKVIIFVDAGPDNRWEKFYYNDPGGTATGSNATGMVTYRHGRSAVVSFADSHAEVFQVKDPNGTGQNEGLHAAFLDKSVTYKAIN
jgi:prepilin-type processing-associated H-X9-DG protein